MQDIKNFLLYLTGLLGLIGASFLFANQGEPPEITPLPTLVPPTKVSSVDKPEVCANITQSVIFIDVPDAPAATRSEEDRLFISGTIYASDGMTPLPGARVKVWREAPVHKYQGYVPLTHTQTGDTGGYSFSTINPNPHRPISIQYRVSYDDACLLSMHLDMMKIPLPEHSLQQDVSDSLPPVVATSIAQVRLTGPVIHGPVDIVLPVPPSVP